MGERFECDLCVKTYSQHSNLLSHKRDHKAGTEAKRQWGVKNVLWLNAMRTPGVPHCLICGPTKCSSVVAIRVHIRIKHPETLHVMKVHLELMSELKELRRWARLREPDNPSMIDEIKRRLSG